MSSIVVIDLGTSYFKFASFERDGRLRAAVRLPVFRADDASGRTELAADAFTRLIASGLDELGNSGNLADAEAITFATQTNSFVLLDRQDQPVTPLILWPDRRALEYEPHVRRLQMPATVTGVPELSHQFMLAKLLWIRDRQPEAWARTRRVCLISDYLTWLFTGQCFTEAGAAGLTGLVDIRTCDWLHTVAAEVGIRPGWLPAIVRAGTDLGPLGENRWGLPPACRFVVGCLDQYAGAIGAGNAQPGRASETTGTVLATVRCIDELSHALPRTVFQGPAFLAGRWFQMVFGETSANYLEWFRHQQPDRPSFDHLTAEAEAIAPGADGLRIRTGAPPTTTAEVFGGATGGPRGRQVRCILEAVAFALRDQLHTLFGSALPNEIRSVGGAGRSRLWLQIKADVLGIDVRPIDCPEPTSLGAAILAESSLSGGAVESIADAWVRLGPAYRPDREAHRRYRELELPAE